MRLDQYITEKLEISKNKTQALIKAWAILINWKISKKPWLKLKWDEKVEINRTDESNYVSRSALKLKYFLEEDNLGITWKIAMDIWSSTWWFCQVMLEKNIGKIYAIDVWTSQLHKNIKSDLRIIPIENTDIRKLNPLIEDLDLITCDVSFISLKLIIDSIYFHMSDKIIVLLLFKPQFEVWSKYINKKWVVKNDKVSEKKLNDFLQICRDNWLQILKVEESKLHWENWNKEVVIKLKKKM